MFFIFLFLFSLVIGCYSQGIVEPSSHLKHTDDIVKKKHHGNDHWKLQMVYNNYLAVRREKTTEQYHKGAMHLGVNVPPGFEDAEMSFFYGMGQPNMLIEFINTENDPLFTTDLLPSDAYESSCSGQFVGRKPGSRRLYGFCELRVKPLRWKIANGTYNRPSKTPHCIYDFHKAATLNNEYEFFRYCAKGYFYQDMHYLDYAQSKIAKFNWLLYLAEGQLQCKISGNVEADRQLLAKGYTVELIQYNYPQRLLEDEDMALCPRLSATLTSYHDKRKDGKFFFAAMVGATQLDGQFEWAYKESMGFWDEATYKEEYKSMNLAERACYLQYHKQLLRDDGRYGLKIKITHFCSERGMRTSTSFDVSVGPDQVPDGIHEDTGLVIDLTEKHLRRTTAQTICVVGWQNGENEPKCEVTEKPFLKDHYLGPDALCNYTYQCPLGDICSNTVIHGPGKIREGEATCRHAVESPPTKPDCKSGKPACRDDEFCMLSSDSDIPPSCQKMNQKEEGEPCCCKNDWDQSVHDACFYYFICTSDGGWGECKRQKDRTA